MNVTEEIELAMNVEQESAAKGEAGPSKIKMSKLDKLEQEFVKFKAEMSQSLQLWGNNFKRTKLKLL